MQTATSIAQEISKLRAANQRLSEIWLGQAAASFIEKFESLMPQMQKLKAHLEAIYQKILAYADQMAGRDQADAGKFTAKFDLLADLNPLSAAKTSSLLQAAKIMDKKAKIKEKSISIKNTDQIKIISVTYDGGGATYVINDTTNRLIRQEGGNFLKELSAYEQGIDNNIPGFEDTPKGYARGKVSLGVLAALQSAAEISSSIQTSTTSMSGKDYLETQKNEKQKKEREREIESRHYESTLGNENGEGPIFAGNGSN